MTLFICANICTINFPVYPNVLIALIVNFFLPEFKRCELDSKVPKIFNFEGKLAS